MNSKTIWNEKQNKPSLIANDLSPYVSENIVYESLLKRGVFKWLAVRRDLIRLKQAWKIKVTQSICSQKTNPRRALYWKGYRKALEECRAEIRSLCHSERWRAPDFDKRAGYWLANKSGEIRDEKE